ncbi:MAG: V-type ATP synthase subunit D [Candidatus Omnitrophica bacterium]|nr:V-type ATP synthase subunit D [Candidatus Omnitrophota bacterium]
MPKIRLTKNELKGQKDGLARFRRYLPMLLLRKKQLQLEIIKVHQTIKDLGVRIDNLRSQVISWVDVFAEEVPIQDIVSLKAVEIEKGNVAGIDLPVFIQAVIKEEPYDFMFTPLWVDAAILAIKQTLTLKARLAVYHQQMDILKEELRIATQRVNLFEKIKIPEARENIRVIQIYLGELQTAGVVRGKIAKAKLQKKKLFELS